MKILNVLLSIVFCILLLGLGVWLIAGSFGLDYAVFTGMLDDLAQRSVMGLILVLLVVIYILSALPRRKKDRLVSYEYEGGKVSVSVKAINAMLARLADEFAAVVNVRASVNPRDRSVRLDMSVRSGAKVQEVSQAIQERVRESMQDNLGIADVGDIKIYVREIMPSEEDREEPGEWQNMPI